MDGSKACSLSPANQAYTSNIKYHYSSDLLAIFPGHKTNLINTALRKTCNYDSAYNLTFEIYCTVSERMTLAEADRCITSKQWSSNSLHLSHAADVQVASTDLEDSRDHAHYDISPKYFTSSSHIPAPSSVPLRESCITMHHRTTRAPILQSMSFFFLLV